MDPNANLKTQEWLLNQIAVCRGPNRKRNLETELSELRQALYDWIRDGGFEPVWEDAPKASPYFIGNRQEQTMRNRKQAVKVMEQGTVVATEKLDSQANSACLPAGNQEQSVLSDPSFIGGEGGASNSTVTQEKKMAEVTATFKGSQKNGMKTFNAGQGSWYANKSLFAREPREGETITITGPEDLFAPEGASRSPKALSPEKAEKAAAKLAKDKERFEKAQARIKKQEEALAKLQSTLNGGAAAQPTA